MRFRTLGKSGIEASVIGLGTWVDEGWIGGSANEQNMIGAIQAGLDSGINFIDTAPVYGLGFAEEVVGKAIQGRRDKAVLASKCGLVWNTNKGKHLFCERDQSVNRYLGEESIRFEVEESLRRLRTDYLDLYQIQVFDPDRPIEEPVQTMLELKQQGKIRAIGICSPDMQQLETFHRDCELDVVQQSYSLLDRRAEVDILPYCFNHAISVMVWSPLIQGLITGKIGPDQRYAEPFEGDSTAFNSESLRAVANQIGEFDLIAKRYGSNLTQLAIAWTVQSAGVTHVLVGAFNANQAREAAWTGDISLSQDDVEQMNAVVEGNLVEREELLWSL
jgi:aryl-alcohol dehydrogenase-like predicted oxidoreductase